MERSTPGKGITCLTIPGTENAPVTPVSFSTEEGAFLRLESCEFTPREVFRLKEEGAEGQVLETANGEITVFRGEQLEEVRSCRRAALTFSCREGQLLTGLGQHERGILDYSRETERLYAHNMKIPVPFVLGGDGWGLLLHTGCAMHFYGLGGGFRLELDAVDDLRMTVLHGEDCGEVLRMLSAVAGKPKMLPKWAFGYIQSKERYRSAEELITTAREFRRRGLGLDCIVLDWMSWREGCWGDKQPDPERFPDVRALTETLHEMNVRLMVSVWPNMVKGSDCDEFTAAHGFLPGTQTYDAFSPEARDLYWKQARKGWMDGGTDALWCDSCEPVTDPDWCGDRKRPEEERERLLVSEAEIRMDPARMLLYGETHAEGLDAHWQADFPGKRTMILARSGGLSSAAHGTVLWSGDISASWDVLRGQVTEAVRSAMSGLHYWTLDIGGFFTDKKEQWFWNGSYPEGTADPAYRELYARWFQFGAMLPVFRSHGTDTPREPWRFEEQYPVIRDTIRLRYRLLPYLYSTAAQACETGMPMLRGMAVCFGGDEAVRTSPDCFMTGDALLVKPVTRPLEEGGARTTVRLPAGADWYNWFTHAFRRGGEDVTEETPMDRFPLYVRAGSVVPVSDDAESTAEVSSPASELLVFTGADGCFELYDDAGDGNGAGQGDYLRIPMSYSEETGVLTLGNRQGRRSAECSFTVRFILPEGEIRERTVHYTGRTIQVSR